MEHFHYHYDQVTGAYLGANPCNESPEEPGVHLLPAWTTLDPPPEFGEGEMAFYLFGEWVVKPAEIEAQVEAAVVGLVMEPEDKIGLMRDLAAQNIDIAARALGFKDMADAVTYIGEDSQQGLDAKALRAWRAIVNDRLALVYDHYEKHPDAPQPLASEFNLVFATAEFKREFKQEAAVVPSPGLAEANRVLMEAALVTQMAVNATPTQIAAENAKLEAAKV